MIGKVDQLLALLYAFNVPPHHRKWNNSNFIIGIFNTP